VNDDIDDVTVTVVILSSQTTQIVVVGRPNVEQ